MTKNASEHGTQIDSFLEASHWFMLVLFVGWSLFFLYTLYRFWHRRNPKANYTGVTSHASSHVEISVIVVEAILLLGFALPLWAKRVNEIPPEGDDVIRVHAIAEQFGWTFHYAGADGVRGRQNPSFISSNNPIGLDPDDVHGKDDIVTRTYMNVPVNTPVVVDVTSKDVIHNYCVPNMRISQDAVPGMSIPIWFTPIRTGEFEIVCAQLCGAGHFSMKGFLVVQSPHEYRKWMESKAPEKEEHPDEASPEEETPESKNDAALAISSANHR